MITSRLTPAQWVLLAFAVVSVVVIVKLATGVGPDLPGEELGIVGSEPPGGCDVDPEHDETPAAPQPAEGRWRAEDALPEPRNEPRAVTVGGRVLIVGAQDEDSEGNAVSSGLVHSFDPESGTYRRLPDIPLPIDHAALATYEGDLYVVGGSSNGTPTNRAWRFSPDEREWQELAPMSTARYAPAGDVIGHRFYVTGGSMSDAGTPFNSMEVYDFETGEWLSGPDMPTARHHHSAVEVDGDLYVAGGRRPGEFSLDSFERFDPETNEWEELPALPQGTGGNAAVATEDEVVVAGGGDDLGTGGAEGVDAWVTRAVWAFDREAMSWRRLPDLTLPRHGHAAALANGRVYVFGGAPCPSFGLTDQVESLPIR
jgi:N-acetylneuraminic acid mutarotase